MPDSIFKSIADNDALLKALRELLERQFSPEVDLKDLARDASDEILGQFLRARIAGMNAIDRSFKEINQYKSVQPVPEARNPAR